MIALVGIIYAAGFFWFVRVGLIVLDTVPRYRPTLADTMRAVTLTILWPAVVVFAALLGVWIVLVKRRSPE